MKRLIVIFGIIFQSFTYLKADPTEKSATSENIIGRWCSASRVADFPHLTFRQDGYVIVDCKIDTVFGLKYTMKADCLLLERANRTEVSKILRLTRDSLILESLLGQQMRQEYYRCKN